MHQLCIMHNLIQALCCSLTNGIKIAPSCISQQSLRLKASIHVRGLYTSRTWLRPGCTPRSIWRWHWCTRSPLDGKQRERGKRRESVGAGVGGAVRLDPSKVGSLFKPPHVYTSAHVEHCVVGRKSETGTEYSGFSISPIRSVMLRWISGQWHH